MGLQESTDIWFRTALPLEELATSLGASVRISDAEDYWQWVIADIAGITIDITRTHTKAADETDTRIFASADAGVEAFPQQPLRLLIAGLQRIGIEPIHIGTWVHTRGQEYDRVVHQRIEGPAPVSYPDAVG